MGFIPWKIARGGSITPAPFSIMGIVNVTPDSFFDGGRYAQRDSAVAHARELIDQGADILDIGGESTRPFSDPVSPSEELERVLPVVEAAAAFEKNVPISVDTRRAVVASRTLDAGAAIINDVSGCLFDPELAEVVAEYKPGYVLMHSQGTPENMQIAPQYDDVVAEVLEFFEERMHFLTQAGLPEENIVLDPGIGFGKNLEHNLALLREIDRFYSFGRPLLVGFSNKGLWKDLLKLEKEPRQNATQAGTAVMAVKGVAIHRVHAVDLTVQTLGVVRALTGE